MHGSNFIAAYRLTFKDFPLLLFLLMLLWMLLLLLLQLFVNICASS